MNSSQKLWGVVEYDEAIEAGDDLIDGLLSNSATFIVGRKGVGKTTVAAVVSHAVLDPAAFGYSLCGRSINPAGVERALWLCTDAGEARIRRRDFGRSTEPYGSRVKFLKLLAPDQTDLTSGYWREVAAEIKDFDPGFIVLDHTGGVVVGSQNDDVTANAVMGRLKSLERPFLALHHSTDKAKRSATPRSMGHAQWEANARVILRLGLPASGSLATTMKVESNRAAHFTLPIRIDPILGTLTVAAHTEAPNPSRAVGNDQRVAQLAALAVDLGGIDRSTGKLPAARRLLMERPNDVTAIWGGKIPRETAIDRAIGRALEVWKAGLPA